MLNIFFLNQTYIKIIKAFIFVSTCITTLNAEINPFSKIIITSDTATCEKSKENNFLITYKNNVTIKLADESTIQANYLIITLKDIPFNSTSTDNRLTVEKKSENPFAIFEKIILKDHIKMVQKNRSIEADRLELFPKQKRCELFGNIKIQQIKEKAKDLPITAEGSKAILDLNTQEISLLGDTKKPVTTTIIIEGYPTLLKKIKTKQEKRAAKRAKHLTSRRGT